MKENLITSLSKTGHFYFATIGHYHVAATQNAWARKQFQIRDE
jgi:hypothetical protein